jgi:SpoVK/Ycf46/Vps4 family AAA+-type ATPase
MYVWGDLILPAAQMDVLKNICSQVRYKYVVYEEWGFAKKLSRGKGVNILFSGPPGTGKTMAAEVIANELGLELYKIDLSAVVSKYIGETEKNLQAIFDGAYLSNAILFFDEADALFGKRSEVKDAHDRYANIEISYLLQKMEEYDGVVVLATNLKNNIDEAFARRVGTWVEFVFPEVSLRERIWETIFPKDMPIQKNIDFSFLARKFQLAGGNIKNIAVASAFLAAEKAQAVGMEHIIPSVKRELAKLGKTCTKSDFGEFECYYGGQLE